MKAKIAQAGRITIEDFGQQAEIPFGLVLQFDSAEDMRRALRDRSAHFEWPRGVECVEEQETGTS